MNMISDRDAQTLSKLESSVSVYDHPELWLQENSDHLRAAFGGIPGLCSADIAGLLYPRAMIYVHIVLGMSGKQRTTISSAIFDRWAPVNQISQLSHHQNIQDSIRDHLGSIVHPPIIEENWEKIQLLDNLSLLARAIIVVKDHRGVRDFVQERGPGVDPFLNLLQELLDAHYVGPARPLILRSLLDLSKQYCVYPKSLILQGVDGKSSMLMACGSFGNIYQGTYQKKVVAIKAMRQITAKDPEILLKAFIREAVLWRQFKHPNVLQFHGIHQWPTAQGHTICLVSPWMDHKNMVEYLDSNPDADRLSLMLDVAQGLQYLHEFQDPAVIHGDLKGNNILITDDRKACLTDFGLCTLIEDATLNSIPTPSTTFTGPLKYLAPELLQAEADNPDCLGTSNQPRKLRRTTASDIYAFGCVCYQMLTGHPRYLNLSFLDTILAVLKNRDIAKPEACADELWTLIKSCWEVAPSSRPLINDIVKDLKANLADSKRYDYPSSSTFDHPSTSAFDHPSLSTLDHPSSSTLDHLIFSDTPSPPASSSLYSCTEVSKEQHTFPREFQQGSRAENGASISDTPGASAISIPKPIIIDPIHKADAPSSSSDASNSNLEVRVLANKPIMLRGDQTKELRNDDIIIAVLGLAGTGKSSFINAMMCGEVAQVGDDLESCTQSVEAFGCIHPDGSGRRVIIVDTPGFDDTRRLDWDILSAIAQWLETTYRRRITLSGILHFHSIAEPRMRGTPLKNLGMFQALCGDTALANVVLTTTNWDRVPSETGSRREAELKTKFWHPLIEHGSRVARFQPRTYEAAWDLIGLFTPTSVATAAPRPRPALQIQIEQVIDGKKLHQTAVYEFLLGWWSQLLGNLKRKSDKFKLAKKQKNQLESRISPISPLSKLGQRA